MYKLYIFMKPCKIVIYSKLSFGGQKRFRFLFLLFLIANFYFLFWFVKFLTRLEFLEKFFVLVFRLIINRHWKTDIYFKYFFQFINIYIFVIVTFKNAFHVFQKLIFILMQKFSLLFNFIIIIIIYFFSIQFILVFRILFLYFF